MKTIDYQKPIHRSLHFLFAIPLAFFGILATGFSLFVFYLMVRNTEIPKNVYYSAIIFLPVGLFCFLIMYRLITGRSKRLDGGLFSPTVLRLFGMLFISYPIIFILLKSALVIESIGSVVAGIACFRLASKRADIATEKFLSRTNTQPCSPADIKGRATTKNSGLTNNSTFQKVSGSPCCP